MQLGSIPNFIMAIVTQPSTNNIQWQIKTGDAFLDKRLARYDRRLI
jgi:hypothetical protein